MKNINEYIFEKLVINKKVGKSLEDKLGNLYLKIIDIIMNYLSNKDYFDFEMNKFKLTSKSENEISLCLPNEIKLSLIDSIGDDISIKINRELKLNFYWSYDSGNKTISWSEKME